jgi:hypothetical protein
MRKHTKVSVLVLLCIMFVCPLGLNAASDEWASPFSNNEEWSEHIDDWEKINPETVSETDFYRAEYALIAGSLGSGGYFLGKDEIAWLSQAVRSLEKRGITVRDQWNRQNVYEDSFRHLKQDAQ